MRYTTGKMKGELKTPEIRKLIKAHNVLVSINIPKGAKREDIIALLTKKGYMINHEKGILRPVSKGKVRKLPVVGQATIKINLPKPKTAEEKKQAKVVRDKKKEVTETKAFEKRKAQVDAIKKIQLRRKKGNMGKVDPNAVPEFKTIKQLENYFMTALDKFIKTDAMKFVNKIKGMEDIKEIQKGRKELSKLGNQKVLDILEENADLFDEELGEEKGTEKYEELDTRYENRFDQIRNRVQERIKELKK